MQRLRRARVATCGALGLLVGLSAVGTGAPALRESPGAAPPGAAAAREGLAPPIAVAPLATMRITGGFGESRSNHFHAGLDLSTAGCVGVPVRAPLAGFVERVRASGVGYGRSLYLRARDGRLLVFGHLDAFAAAVAAYVDSAQRTGGQYEQDLWPPAGALSFAAGETLAWSGASGAGGPHVHVEIRHGDFALHPLRAGFAASETTPPRLESITLEPLDEASWVARSAAPLTRPLRATPETVLVEGRVRAAVRSRAGLANASGVPAWLTGIAWGGESLEARLDSISWANEMSEQDLVLDRGRMNGSLGLILQRPEAFTPRFLKAGHGERAISPSGAAESDAGGAAYSAAVPWDGVIELRVGDPPRALTLVARDPGGLATERMIWLRGPAPRERGPDTSRAGGAPHSQPLAWSFASLPAGRLRVRCAGAPAGLRAVRLSAGSGPGASAAASWDGAGWSAVVVPATLPNGTGLEASGRLPGGRPWTARAEAMLWPAGADLLLRPAEFAQLALPPDAVYESGIVITRIHAPSSPAGGALAAVSPRLEVAPGRYPLRRPVPIAFSLGAGEDPTGLDVYRLERDGWTPMRGRRDESARLVRAEVSTLGTFALMRDRVAPRVALRRPARHAPSSPYPRWELIASAGDDGSGIDARATAFEVDGTRVPTEWDAEQGTLRWRPARVPGPGAHRVRVVARDRAGNETRSEGSFVLDSGRR